MASPFIMALNGLVSRKVAGNVKTLRLCGEWRDYGAEECAKVGRVPDNDMMLSTLTRVAIEKMTALENFRYDISITGWLQKRGTSSKGLTGEIGAGNPFKGYRAVVLSKELSFRCQCSLMRVQTLLPEYDLRVMADDQS